MSSLLWSPSSTHLLITSGDQIHVLSALDDSFRAAITSPFLPGEKANVVRFGARDSEVLIFSWSDVKLSIFDLTKSTAVEIANPKFHQPSSVARSYAIRSESGHLALLTRVAGKDFISIHHPLTRQVQKSWHPETIDAQGVIWTPDGQWLILWESASLGHGLVLYTADGEHFRTITASNLSSDEDAALHPGIKMCQPSPNSELCAVGDHGRDIAVLRTESWRRGMTLTHPTTIEPRDTLQVWQEQLGSSADGQAEYSFLRAAHAVSPPGMPSEGKQTETKPGCSIASFDASSTLLATKLDDAPCTIWIWDLSAAELRAVLIFHSVVNLSWHPSNRELLLITCQDETRQGLSYLWDPISQGPTPIVPEHYLSVTNSVGASAKVQVSWIDLDAEQPVALISTAQQYRLLSVADGDQVPRTWSGGSKWDVMQGDADMSTLSGADGGMPDDTFSFKNN